MKDSRASPRSVALLAFSQYCGTDVSSLLLPEISEISFLRCSLFRLFAREDGKHVVQIVGLREVQVDSVDQLLEVMFGIRSLSTAARFADL